MALDDAGLRARLRDDLRDSPFPLHALHLESYLRGTAGSPIAAKAAAALGVGVDAFITMMKSGTDLELVMPRPLDRVSWNGDATLDVTATALKYNERRHAGRVSEPGYSVGGHPGTVNTFVYSSRPYVIARPAENKFPADAEALRMAAPTHAGLTVTTPAEERALMRVHGRARVAAEKAAGLASNGISAVDLAPSMIIQCGDPGAPPDCDTPPPSPPPAAVGGGGATLSSTMTKNYCYGVTTPLNATTDRDNDRIADNCEAQLASRLAPLLNIGNWDNVPARQPYWAAARHPDRPDNVQIIYALAYLADGGYDIWGHGHEGDSEFIILEVKNVSGSKWGTIEATLSAHFNSEEYLYPGSGIYTGLDSYYWDDLDYPQGPFPRIWSALDKHANYRNRAACESGEWMQDSCGGDYFGTQIPAPDSRNLGNYFHVPPGTESAATERIDCTQWLGASSMYYHYRTGQECFWLLSNDRFAGWVPEKPDVVTPYWRIFQIFGF